MSEERATLPIEVIELIIDELSTYLDDTRDGRQCRNDLSNCTLICRGLYPRASSHLFNRVEISQRSGAINHMRMVEMIESLYEILDQNQALCSRINLLSLETYNNSSSPLCHLLNKCHLTDIFSRLANVVGFSWINHSLPLSWASFSPSFNNGFRLLMSKPSLNSLKLLGIETFDSRLLLQNNNLKNLELSWVEPPTSTQEAATGDITYFSTLSSIRTHVNCNAPRITHELLSLSPLFFSRLRDLRIWMRSSREVDGAWAIMQSASQTLETLDVDDLSHFQCKSKSILLKMKYNEKLKRNFFTDPTLIPGPVDLGILVRLRHLKLRCVIASGDGVIFPMGICGLLCPKISPSNVENVEIAIDWVDCRIGTETMRFVDEPRWVSLDEALSDPATLPNLRRVSLILRLGYGWRRPDNPPSTIVAVKDLVQGLASRLLTKASRRSSVKVGIQVLIYWSRYAAGAMTDGY